MIYIVFEEQKNGNKKFALFLFHCFFYFKKYMEFLSVKL